LPAVEIHGILRLHLTDLYAFYGEQTGVKIARKHIAWYTKGIDGAARFRHAMNQLADVEAQLAATDEFFLGSPSLDAANQCFTYKEMLAA
jgi:tRNA-dihydrouridine synthase B